MLICGDHLKRFARKPIPFQRGTSDILVVPTNLIFVGLDYHYTLRCWNSLLPTELAGNDQSEDQRFWQLRCLLRLHNFRPSSNGTTHYQHIFQKTKHPDLWLPQDAGRRSGSNLHRMLLPFELGMRGANFTQIWRLLEMCNHRQSDIGQLEEHQDPT